MRTYFAGVDFIIGTAVTQYALAISTNLYVVLAKSRHYVQYFYGLGIGVCSFSVIKAILLAPIFPLGVKYDHIMEQG